MMFKGDPTFHGLCSLCSRKIKNEGYWKEDSSYGSFKYYCSEDCMKKEEPDPQ
ncbi:hypothetical protein [Bacillus sp. FJAT-44742]|uniref:hypothetical protein n=1 Tax=Bacillus sp. FJAT-44742 TaxID=2014005 RepID=UPI0018E24D0D|nr:hypothetical protein [Bacillus sp. FJAT-44742]